MHVPVCVIFPKDNNGKQSNAVGENFSWEKEATDCQDRYRIAGNFRGIIFSLISIINHIRGGKIVVSESIIANHTCASLVRVGKIRGFVLTTKSTKILPLENLMLYGMYAVTLQKNEVMIRCWPQKMSQVSLLLLKEATCIHTVLGRKNAGSYTVVSTV